MSDAANKSRDPGPWWWPQVACAWLAITVADAALTWAGQTFDSFWLTTALTAALTGGTFLVILLLVMDAEDWWNEDFHESNRYFRNCLVLLVGTLVLGCGAGMLLS